MQGTNTTHIVEKNLRKDRETLIEKEGERKRERHVPIWDFGWTTSTIRKRKKLKWYKLSKLKPLKKWARLSSHYKNTFTYPINYQNRTSLRLNTGTDKQFSFAINIKLTSNKLQNKIDLKTMNSVLFTLKNWHAFTLADLLHRKKFSNVQHLQPDVYR